MRLAVELPLQGFFKSPDGVTATDAHLSGGFYQRLPGVIQAAGKIHQGAENTGARPAESVDFIAERGLQVKCFTLDQRADLGFSAGTGISLQGDGLEVGQKDIVGGIFR